jgi:hypothetical protein
MSDQEKILKINMVKTDNECFISDCMAISGYDWNYHQSKLKDFYFDGKLPTSTFSPNWVMIEKYPTTIQQLCGMPDINHRYKIKDKDMISSKLPEIINYEDKNDYSEDILYSLYEHKSNKQEPVLKDVKCEIDIVMEVENFKMPPKIDYNAIKKIDYSNREFRITNKNINHQLFDKLIFPEIMLHSRPCSISSHDLYCLVRQYIRENIDTKVAKITSDYDFCFTVQKVVPLIEPENVTYQNIFARTKKERNKIHYSVKSFKEFEIFNMTHDQSKYEDYRVIQPIFADNEEELKNKIDEFLQNLIEIINKPLELCPYCNGTGYKD